MNKGPCTISGCGKPAQAKGLCQMHYWRNKVYGDPNYAVNSYRHSSSGGSKITIDGDIARVELTRGKEAIIDASDVPLVQGITWFLSNGYAYNGKLSIYLYQRLLGPAPEGQEIRYIDKDSLNCRRENLQFAPRFSGIHLAEERRLGGKTVLRKNFGKRDE